jgi:hypothetical protein
MNRRHADGGDEQPDRVPDLDTLAGLLEQSSYASAVTDPGQLQHQMFALLADNEDPMWREIGQQLRDGRMSLRQVAEVDAYWQHVAGDVDEQHDAFRDTLHTLQTHLEAELRGRRK